MPGIIQTTIKNTANMVIVESNTAQIFMGETASQDYDYTAGGAEVTLEAGQVVGVIAATGKIVPSLSTNTDGSQYPVGVLMVDQTIAANATKKVCVIVRGKVRGDKLKFGGSDTLTTAVSGKRNREMLLAVGIEVINVTDNSVAV